MTEKPWHELIRDNLGWASLPLRAYQLYKLARGDNQAPQEPTKPPDTSEPADIVKTFFAFFSAKLELKLAELNWQLPPDLDYKLSEVASELWLADFSWYDEPSRSDAIAHARWRDERNRVVRNHQRTEEWIDVLVEALLHLLLVMPPTTPGPYTCAIPTTDKMVQNLTNAIVANTNPDFFKKLKPKLIKAIEDKQPILESIRGTPLSKLFPLTTTFCIPLKTWTEHGFLFAQSGYGKSQTMRTIIADLIDQDCALFLLDGNGALIKDIDKIKSIKDRVVILDPEETPALNFFSMHGASREKQHELFFYLFKAIDQSLTERQATMVSYLVDLMQSIPGATFDTLRNVCESKAPLYPVDALEPIAQDFFIKQFYSRDALINQTKAQIAARLYTIGRNRLFNSMFSSPENKFSALQLMQEKKIVIVNTTRDKLGDQGSAVFGRYILAQCLAAAWQRPENNRHLALLVVDEAKTYLDDQSKKILSDARHFGLGLLLASQFPDQLEDGVRKEVINNTSVKFAGPASYSVVAQIHRDMRCEADFILNMKKKDFSHAEWACYVANVTSQAIKLTIPFGMIEKLPQLSAAEHQALRTRNRARFASTPAPRTKPPPLPPKQPNVTPQNQETQEYDTDI